MFSKILIANRGEIAGARSIRACRELGVRSVAVYSEADAECLHVRYADEAVCIGPPPAAQSYLVMPALIQAAQQTGAEAIHPGYGFLAERAEFSRLCREQGIKFIGPSPESIELMGDKAQARVTMTAAGVPVTPGFEGIIESAAEAEVVARDIGLPVMIKASAGGGGKGIRIAREASELAGAVRQAQAEAEAAFGNGAVYVEKYIGAPRHIEDPGARRWQGPRHPSRRARLQHPAPPPGPHRGGAVAGCHPRAARPDGPGRGRRGRRRGVRGRRHRRVPARSRRG